MATERKERGMQTEKLAEIHEQLREGVEGLRDSAEWQRVLQVGARFHKYSLTSLGDVTPHPNTPLTAGRFLQDTLGITSV